METETTTNEYTKDDLAEMLRDYIKTEKAKLEAHLRDLADSIHRAQLRVGYTNDQLNFLSRMEENIDFIEQKFIKKSDNKEQISNV